MTDDRKPSCPASRVRSGPTCLAKFLEGEDINSTCRTVLDRRTGGRPNAWSHYRESAWLFVARGERLFAEA